MFFTPLLADTLCLVHASAGSHALPPRARTHPSGPFKCAAPRVPGVAVGCALRLAIGLAQRQGGGARGYPSWLWRMALCVPALWCKWHCPDRHLVTTSLPAPPPPPHRCAPPAHADVRRAEQHLQPPQRQRRLHAVAQVGGMIPAQGPIVQVVVMQPRRKHVCIHLPAVSR